MKIKLITKTAHIPTRGTALAGGFDLYADIDSPLNLYPGRIVQINTGVAMEIPEGHVGLIMPRSGLGTKHGIFIANTVPVIDADYRGEILVFLSVRGPEPYTINPGDRFAQMLITPVFTPQLEVVDELSETARGTGGWGSTGT